MLDRFRRRTGRPSRPPDVDDLEVLEECRWCGPCDVAVVYLVGGRYDFRCANCGESMIVGTR